MNYHQQEAKLKAEVMLAFAEGKNIQVKNDDEDTWVDIPAPRWNWYQNDYQVKPAEPIVRGAIMRAGLVTHLFLTKEAAGVQAVANNMLVDSAECPYYVIKLVEEVPQLIG